MADWTSLDIHRDTANNLVATLERRGQTRHGKASLLDRADDLAAFYGTFDNWVDSPVDVVDDIIEKIVETAEERGVQDGEVWRLIARSALCALRSEGHYHTKS